MFSAQDDLRAGQYPFFYSFIHNFHWARHHLGPKLSELEYCNALLFGTLDSNEWLFHSHSKPTTSVGCTNLKT